MNGLDCFIALLDARGLRPQMNGNGSGKARCPAHDDQNPSLSFRAADRRPGVIAHCFVCQASLESMLDSLAATPDQRATVLGHAPPAATPRGPARREFVYRDAAGAPLFRVVRREPKGFHQERAGAGGRWIKNLTGVQPVPYRLPELLAAIARGDTTIWIAEGEKNVEDLVALGLEATCNAGGAGKWRDSYAALLAGARRAIICTDFDDIGRRHGELVAHSLLRAGIADVTLLEFEGLKGNDVSDWLERQPEAERLARLLDYARASGRPPGQNGNSHVTLGPAHGAPPPPLTDTGNAERLVRDHGADLRYVSAWGTWLVWDGRRWQADASGEVMRRTKDVVRGIYHEASGKGDDERQAFARWALKSESSRARAAMIGCAESELPVAPDQLDADPWVLNVENGTLDLKTGQLREHRRDDLITKLAPVTFDAAATHPVWDRFLARMVPDPDVQTFLQRAAGYTLTGDTSEEKLFFIHGPTASGKSTFIAALQGVLGEYASTCNFETFLQQDRGGGVATTDLARLPGVRMAVSLEVDEGRKLAVAVLKSITGRDLIAARHLYQEAFLYMPAFKLWLVANDKPRANAADGAIWRRILMVPFEESLALSDQDPGVKVALMGEARSAILAWAVAGLAPWRAGGLNPAEAVNRATSQYRQEQDSVRDFIDDRCVISIHDSVSNARLWKAYQDWCAANGERPMSAKALATRLKGHGLSPIRSNSERGWSGVRLRDQFEQMPAF